MGGAAGSGVRQHCSQCYFVQQIGKDLVDVHVLVEAGADPHIWLCSPLVMLQARSIVRALQAVDPAHRSIYEANYRAFILKIVDLDAQLRSTFDGLIERISTGGRAFYYGMAPNAHHRPHPHFYCKRCGQMDCLTPDSLNVDSNGLWKTFPGRIDKVEVRVDGICKNCMK